MEQKSYSTGRLTWALFFILIGCIFLLNNFGLVAWDVWANLWRLWPIFLIAWGVQLLLGQNRATRIIAAVINLALVLIFLAYVVAQSNSNFRLWLEQNFPAVKSALTAQTSELKQGRQLIEDSAYSGVRQREISVVNGVGKTTLTDALTTDYLDFSYSFYEELGQPSVEAVQNSDLLELKVTQNNKPAWLWFNQVPQYELVVGRTELPSKLELTTGTGSLVAKLDSTKVTELSLKVGTGSAEVELASYSLPKKLTVTLGTGSATLHLPKGVGLRLKPSIGVGSVTLDGNKITDSSSVVVEPVGGLPTVELEFKVGTGSAKILTN